MMQVSFYVLGERYASSATIDTASDAAIAKAEAEAEAEADPEAVLLFVCKLIQTVVKKSEHSLVVIDDQPERLQLLDTLLWSFDATSFIPHELVLQDTTTTALLSAPVTLLSHLPEGFDGVILNLGAAPLPLPNLLPYSASNQQKTAALPNRVLEIISPDEVSKEQGRQKYRAYRELGFDLVHHIIN